MIKFPQKQTIKGSAKVTVEIAGMQIEYVLPAATLSCEFSAYPSVLIVDEVLDGMRQGEVISHALKDRPQDLYMSLCGAVDQTVGVTMRTVLADPTQSVEEVERGSEASTRAGA